MVQKVTPKHEIVSMAAAAACVTGAPGTVPKSSASTRWQDKGARGRSKGERDEWKKLKKIKIDKYDDFNEWVDGDATMRYLPKDIDARKHLSGWAMRNTNNHNKKVLKKSCLGVFLCSKGCRTTSGEVVTVRPATSDRARKKQGDKKCPRTGCDGKLYHMICAGKSGYPVTHFWRVTDTVILFQSKGIHDHPRPDVVKTTSQAKMALLEYHRTHRHERPKEICRKVQGMHIHKSFNRVDRVARQLREVQNTEGTEPVGDVPKEHFSLRSHLRSMYSNGAQRPADMDNHSYAPGHNTFQNVYSNRQSYGAFYPPQPPVEGWTQFNASQDEYSTAFQNYRPAEAQLHTSSTASGYNHQMAGYPYNHQLHSADGTTYDYGYGGDVVMTASSSSSAGKTHDGLDIAGVHSDMSRQSIATYHSYPAESNIMMTNQSGCVDLNPMSSVYVTTELTSPQQGHVIMTSVKQPGSSPMKRPAPPDLHSLQEAKQPRLQPSAVSEASTIKLAEHTPSINIDLSNFSDIFDIPSGLGEEGLAGRPKTPVYQSLSPAVPMAKSDAAGTPGNAEEGSIKDEQRCSPSVSGETNQYSPTGDENSSVASPTSSVCSQGSPTGSLQTQSPHHPPVLTTLSNHTPTAVPVATSAAGGEGPTNDQDGNFLDQLVSLYLGKEEKPISTLKNEFHVYTDSQSGHRTYTFRPEAADQAHPGASLEHFRAPGHGGHLEYSWYDRSQAYRTSNGLVPATESLISPLMSGHFDYSTSITDYYNSQQAAAAAAAAAAAVVSSNAPTLSAFIPTCQSSNTPSSSGVFGHMSSRHVF
uniref:Glial cells missing transcription factor n=1 Tax=Glyptocidaris crenularis TaxID=31907 RepID=A0A0P0UPR0_9ECHN|nr:glial cells missing transcription factor [Glyptocidaris crenularis]